MSEKKPFEFSVERIRRVTEYIPTHVPLPAPEKKEDSDGVAKFILWAIATFVIWGLLEILPKLQH